ncbi:MAG: hypothetical protein H0U86_11065 [Chloroflexi bacterium]|nr:hypothetical protein [Chloroflexota bacterium]
MPQADEPLEETAMHASAEDNSRPPGGALTLRKIALKDYRGIAANLQSARQRC